MNDLKEIIIPNIPELSLSIRKLETTSTSYETRGRHFHKEFEVFKVEEGEFFLRCEETEMTVSCGDTIFVNSFYIHEFKPKSEHCRATYFQIDLSPYLKEFLEEENYLYLFIQSNQTNNLKIYTEEQPICELLDRIDAEFSGQREYFDLQIKGYMLQFIVFLLRNNFLLDKNTLLNGKDVSKIIPAIEYVNKNLGKKITLDEICLTLHINKFYFCKLFKQLTGATLTEYLNFVRLYKAKLLLINSNLSVSQISFDCGFASIQYFNRLFKKQNGVTPSRYRKLYYMG